MNQIPTQKENPNGLHQRFIIKKIVPASLEYKENMRMIHETTIPPNCDFLDLSKKKEYADPEFMIVDVDKNAEYFVLRLDENGRDKNHIEACRKAVLTYAENIAPFIPELANDLIERYGQ